MGMMLWRPPSSTHSHPVVTVALGECEDSVVTDPGSGVTNPETSGTVSPVHLLRELSLFS